MLQVKVNAALKLLDNSNGSGVLSLSPETIKDLQEKHPVSCPIDESVLIEGELPFVDPAIFNNIDEDKIYRAALKTKGACGPSGLDADGWRRILASKHFGKVGSDFRSTLATFSRTLCRKEVEIITSSDSKQYSNLEAYTACRLIQLDKNPGVRPIGVGEVLRQIIGKSTMSVIKPEVVESAGSLQLCAGQPAGCEAAIHAMTKIFGEEETDGLLLVEASNAFNSLNRKVLLHNIKYICPPMAIYIRNCYVVPSRLFVTGGLEIQSAEGTTQGDPLAMPVYAVGITPLLQFIRTADTDLRHVAFADDLGGAGKFQELRSWWRKIIEYGPKLGYYPKASKSWLVIKTKKQLDLARAAFEGTNLNITCEGRKYLGGFVGSAEGKTEFMKETVREWCDE